jgi:hypothetical protein
MQRMLAALIGLVLTLPALGLPALAQDGFRAVFAGQAGEPDLLVEVAGNGDFRVGPERGDSYGLGLGGDFFLVAREGRSVRVFRAEDMAAVVADVMPAHLRSLFAEAFDTSSLAEQPRMERVGTRRIAGFDGDVWRVSLGSPPEAREVVLSNDPRLKPVGQAMARFIQSNMVMLAPLVGPASGDMVKEARQLFALGTPIGGDGGFQLKSAGPAPVPADRLKLPAEPLGRDELLNSLGKR